MYVSPGRELCMCERFAGRDPSKNGSSGHDEVSFQRPNQFHSSPFPSSSRSHPPPTKYHTNSRRGESTSLIFTLSCSTLIQTTASSQGRPPVNLRRLSSPVSTTLPVDFAAASPPPYLSQNGCSAKAQRGSVSSFKESQGKELR
jgi:hypothetical protein